MTRRLLFRSEAETELLDARRWYEKQRPKLGAEFANAVERLVEHILERLLSRPKVRGETRRAILQRFPYAVYFQVLPEEVVVLAVTHGRRHARHWQSRH